MMNGWPGSNRVESLGFVHGNGEWCFVDKFRSE